MARVFERLCFRKLDVFASIESLAVVAGIELTRSEDVLLPHPPHVRAVHALNEHDSCFERSPVRRSDRDQGFPHGMKFFQTKVAGLPHGNVCSRRNTNTRSPI